MNDAETNRDRGIVMHDRDCARSVSHPPPPPQISVSVSFPSSRQGNNAFARKHTLSYGPGPGSGNTRYKYGSIALSDAAGKTKSKPTSSSTSRSPDRFRDNIHTPNQLNVVPEDQILMQFTESPEIEHSQLQQTFPRSHRMGSSSSLDEAEDEEEMIEELERELDEELGVEGLFRGSYSRLILLYLLSPLTFLIAFGVLAALPYLLWSLNPSSPNPGHTYIYHPFPELLLSSSLFSLAYLIRKPLREGAENVVRWTEEVFYKLVVKMRWRRYLRRRANPTHENDTNTNIILPTLLSTFLYTLIQLSLLLSSLIILDIPSSLSPSPPSNQRPAPTTHTRAFRQVWWIGLGWSLTEATISVWKGYQARQLYRDVLVDVRVSKGIGAGESGVNSPSPSKGNGNGNDSVPVDMSRGDDVGTSTPTTLELFERQRRGEDGDEDEDENEETRPLLLDEPTKIQTIVEDELDELLAIRQREELEEAYGIPVIRIPVFITCLQRINDLLLALGSTLLLSQAFLRSPISLPSPSPSPFPSLTPTPIPLFALPLLWILQSLLALLHTPLVLPKVGVPAAVFTASVLSLGIFFAGLAGWEGVS